MIMADPLDLGHGKKKMRNQVKCVIFFLQFFVPELNFTQTKDNFAGRVSLCPPLLESLPCTVSLVFPPSP